MSQRQWQRHQHDAHPDPTAATGADRPDLGERPTRVMQRPLGVRQDRRGIARRVKAPAAFDQTHAGGSDIVTRVIAAKMRAELGVPVVVENRPGAGGNVGAVLAARQAPDGYTIMPTAAGFAIAPALYQNLNYDALKDFVPVTKIATAPLLVLARADSALRTMSDLIALAKKAPKGVTYGSFGNGSSSHLIGERLSHGRGRDQALPRRHVGRSDDGCRPVGLVRAGFMKAWAEFPDAQWTRARHFIAGGRGVSEWTFGGTRASDGQRVEVDGCV